MPVLSPHCPKQLPAAPPNPLLSFSSSVLAPRRAAYFPRVGRDKKPTAKRRWRGDSCPLQAAFLPTSPPHHRGVSHILPQKASGAAKPRTARCSHLPPLRGGIFRARTLSLIPGPQVSPPGRGSILGCCPHHPAPTFAERHGAAGGSAALGRLDSFIYREIYIFSSLFLFSSFLLLLLLEGNGHIWAKPGRNQRHSEAGTAERRKFLQFRSF